MIRAANAKEVPVGNGAEKTYHRPNQINRLLFLLRANEQEHSNKKSHA